MREIIGWGGLLVVLAAASYLSHFSTPDGPRRAEPLARLGGLSRVELRTETATVTIERLREDGERFTRIRVGDEVFTGNAALDERMDELAELTPERTLGELGPEQLDKTGLGGKGSLQLFEGEELALDLALGDRAGGAGARYARIRGREVVHLLDARLVSDLAAARSRYMQRSLLSTEVRELYGVRLRAGDRVERFVHVNRLSARDDYWARPEAEDRIAEEASNYVDKLLRLAARRYVDEAAFEAAAPVLSTTWTGEDDRELERLELRRAGDAASPRYLARSTATRLPVEVPRGAAEVLERDLALVLGD